MYRDLGALESAIGSSFLRFNAGGVKEQLVLSLSLHIGDQVKISLASWMERL